MKKAHTLYAPALLEKLQLSYPHAYQLLKLEEDDSMQDILTNMQTAGLTQDDLPLIEAALNVFPEYRQILPFPQEDAKYAARLQGNNGLVLLQKFYSFWH